MTRRPTDSPNWGGKRTNQTGRPAGPPNRFVGIRLPVSILDALDALPGTRTAKLVNILKQYLNLNQ